MMTNLALGVARFWRTHGEEILSNLLAMAIVVYVCVEVVRAVVLP